MLLPLASRLSDLHAGQRSHRSGLLGLDTISTIERLCQGMDIRASVETGCGLSTVALSNLSRNHTVFAYDDRDQEDSSVAYAMASPEFKGEATRFVFGPTQVTIPQHDFSAGLDFVLIDGPHGFPFPQLEYYYLYPHLRTGALLALDDIYISNLWDMFACLAEDDMFEFVYICQGKTGFLRRTAAPAISNTGDDWYNQRYSFRKWPMKVVPDAVWGPGQSIDFSDKGNRAEFELLGWAAAESWGSWSDGSEASIAFRWPALADPAGSVRLRVFYGARADIVLLLNGREVGVLPGFGEDGMQERTVTLSRQPEDNGQPAILVFRPTESWYIGEFPTIRRLGIAINSMRYEAL